MDRSKAIVLAVLAAMVISGCSAGKRDLPAWAPPDYFAEVQFAEVEGVRTAYVEGGVGNETTIVFVHGFSGDLQNWWDQFEYFSKEYHVIALDDPGHGKSERSDATDYSMPLAGKVVVGLMDHLGVEKAVLVGNSMGGHIVAFVAINYPERVSKLVLSDAAGAEDMSWMKGLAPMVTPPMIKMVLSGTQYKGDSEKQRARQAHVDSIKGSDQERLYYKALAESIKSLALDSIAGDLGRISAPTLIIWGDNDPVVAVKNAEVFDEKIGDTQIYYVHKGGHTPHMDTPDEFNCAVDNFIKGGNMDACAELNPF